MMRTVTLSPGTNDKIISTPSGRRSVSSSLVSITPLVYSTQNGSNVVGAELGAADGVALGLALGDDVGPPVGEALGEADGVALGETLGVPLGTALGLDDGDPDACDSLSKSHSPPVPAQPTIKL
jgi:phage tail tape-measure protein